MKILSEEEKGLFGMEGAKPAKVRVTPCGRIKKFDREGWLWDN